MTDEGPAGEVKEINPDSEVSADEAKAEEERLRALGFAFPHPDHIEKKEDGSIGYKVNPPVIDKSK